MHLCVGLFLLISCLPCLSGLDNGLALTPPMGWLTWQRYRCNTDCKNDPNNCISESLIRRTADCLVSEGYRDVGYEYVSIDDCWPAKTRDHQQRLQPDPDRFPGGMKNLADYVHSKGLKFGLYEDFGTRTCGGYPGSEFYMEKDANTFAEWGVDLLKLDGCNLNPLDAPEGYPAMGQYLNNTGRPILFSCGWAQYDLIHGYKANLADVRRTCNTWRNFRDVQDSWDSIKNILNYYVVNGSEVRAFSGPGGWNDPDMLAIGNFGLSYDQERLQMAMWTILAAPLIMSMDACNMRPSSKAILQNRRIIAINQDKLGIQGQLVKKTGDIQVWRRPILPSGTFTIAFINLQSGGNTLLYKIQLKDLGLNNRAGYNVIEAFEGTHLANLKPNEMFNCGVNPTGVVMIVATPFN